jgi:hypothetical protein
LKGGWLRPSDDGTWQLELDDDTQGQRFRRNSMEPWSRSGDDTEGQQMPYQPPVD